MKKGKSTYTLQFRCDSDTIQQLMQSYISANGFTFIEKKGEQYFRAGDQMVGYRGLTYTISGQEITINAWLDGAFGDFPLEVNNLNMMAMNYRNSLSTLFQEIENLNGGNIMNNNVNNGQMNFDPNTGQPLNPNMGQQPMMNNQFNGQQTNQMNMQQPMNNQSVNGQQMMNQQFGGQVPNNNQYNQNNYQQPMMNNQFNGQPVYNNNQNSNKSKTKLFIIIGSIILGVAILAIVLVFAFGNDDVDKKYDNENHYEEDNINNPSNDTVNENEYISYKGFDFEKKSGYQYEIDADEQVKTKSDALIQEYRNMGLDVQNYKVSTYDNREVMTFELTQEGQKMIMYITEANENNVILGMAMNRSFIIDYSDINTSVSLIKGLRYSGNYKAPADENMTMEFKNLFE